LKYFSDLMTQKFATSLERGFWGSIFLDPSPLIKQIIYHLSVTSDSDVVL